MKSKILYLSFIMLIALQSQVLCFNDEITHPNITKKAVENVSNLDSYLKINLEIKNGIYTLIPANSQDSILKLLMKGSINEDNPACRASNHFHNPLKAWNESGVNDFLIENTWRAKKVKEFFAIYCDTIGGSEYVPWNSNITWTTGETI